MAKSDLGTIIGLGIAGVGAYWIWSSGLLNSLFTPAVAAAAPAGGVIPASTPPPTQTSIVPSPNATQAPTTQTIPQQVLADSTFMNAATAAWVAKGYTAPALTALINSTYQGGMSVTQLEAAVNGIIASYISNAPPPATQLSGIANALLAAAGLPVTGMLTMDQWNYYYNQIIAGRSPSLPPVSGTTFEAMLAAAGLSDATRATPVNVQQFTAALTSQGLSGIRNNNGHMRRVNYVSPARYAGGQYHMSNNTSPQGRF